MFGSLNITLCLMLRFTSHLRNLEDIEAHQEDCINKYIIYIHSWGFLQQGQIGNSLALIMPVNYS